MTKFAVVTITNNRKSAAVLQTTNNSIVANLPVGTPHIVLTDDSGTTDNINRYTELLWDSLSKADYICYVDDDDLVVNNSIAILQRAIEETGADMAFTDQISLDLKSTAPVPETLPDKPPVTISGILGNPGTARNLCMFKTSAVDVTAVKQAVSQIPAPLDWVFRAWIAAHGKVIHVPIVGYVRRRGTGGTLSRVISKQGAVIPFARTIAFTWMNYGLALRRIPSWTPPTS